MKALIWIFIGGGAGSIARFLLSKWFNNGNFPVGTFLANALASLVLGYFMAKNMSESSTLRFLVAVGFCGGFSTFSTFSFESFKFLQSGQYSMALTHVLLNFLICLACIALGFYLSK